MVVSRCNQFLMEARGVLELAPAVAVALKKGETAAEAIGNVRREISALNQQMIQVRSAPLRKSSRKEAISAYLARLAQRARPKVGFDPKGAARVQWVEDAITWKDDVLGLLAFALGPDALCAAFTRELELEPDPPAL